MRPVNIVAKLWLLLIISSTGYCNNKNTKTVSDTIIIADTNTTVTINDAHSVQVIQLKPIAVAHGNRPVYLKFFNVEMNKNPEGVYEVYMSPEKMNIENLNPSDPYFTGVLDVYTPTSNKSISLKLPKSNLKSLNNIYLTILFRGNQIAGNGSSTNAGEIKISRIQIAEMSN